MKTLFDKKTQADQDFSKTSKLNIIRRKLLFSGARAPQDPVCSGRHRHLCRRKRHAWAEDERLPQASNEVDQGRPSDFGWRQVSCVDKLAYLASIQYRLFWTFPKKTQGQKNSSWKKLKQNFRKSQTSNSKNNILPTGINFFLSKKLNIEQTLH